MRSATKLRREGALLVASGILVWLTGGSAAAASLSPPAGARNVCADAQLSITFSSPPTVGSAVVILVFSDDDTLVDSIGLANAADARRPIGGAVSDSGVVHEFNYFPVLVTGSTAIITLHRQLAYDTSYTVTIDPSVLTDADG